jgi:hypothetical protein
MRGRTLFTANFTVNFAENRAFRWKFPVKFAVEFSAGADSSVATHGENDGIGRAKGRKHHRHGNPTAASGKTALGDVRGDQF